MPSQDRGSARFGLRYWAPAVMLFSAVSLILWLLPGEKDLLLERHVLDASRPRLDAFLTSHLFHRNGWHLSLTLLLMLVAGGILETRWGTPRFVAFYLFTAAGTQLAVLLAGLAFAGRCPPLSCGASGVALGSLVALGFLQPERRALRFLPPNKHLVWILVFLSGAALALLPRLDGEGQYFYLPHVSGAAFAVLFLGLDPLCMTMLRRWRTRRAEERRVRVMAIRRQVDGLLDKISTHGYESLTREEKLFLRQASKHYRTE